MSHAGPRDRERLPLLPAGSALAVAAPAGAFDPGLFARGLDCLVRLAGGRCLRVDPPVYARAGYFAGGDLRRAAHLLRLLGEPGVGGVMAARGGFGTSRLLPLMDLDQAAASGKLIIGFSDLTCLLNPLAARGLITVHGPVVTQLPRLAAEDRALLASLLQGRNPWPLRLEGMGLARGSARGRLLGGNLTMLAHLAGTPWLPDLTGCILLLEDTGEAPYRLDRAWTQLELCGALEGLAGVALGGFAADGSCGAETLGFLGPRLAGLGVPVAAGLPLGHGPRNPVLPLGALAELDGTRGALMVGVELG